MKRRTTVALTVSVVAIAAAAILLYIASIGGFDPSRRVISDPQEGTETQAIENPATPEHPAFPLPNASNFSSSTGINGDVSFAEQILGMAPSMSIVFWHF